MTFFAHGIRESEDVLSFLCGPRGKATGAFGARHKAFETELLGLNVAQIDLVQVWDGAVSLSALAGAGLRRLAESGVNLVSCRRPEDDVDLLNALQAAGMRVVECLVTLARPMSLGTRGPRLPIDVAEAGDADGCDAVAQVSFIHDRLHADPNIDDARADAVKGAWARNSVLGRADRVFVARGSDCPELGGIAGFNACMRYGEQAVIDLIGVAPGYQGRGIGRALVEAAVAYYSGICRELVVGTQSRNVASLGLYQTTGFQIRSSSFTLHAHL